MATPVEWAWAAGLFEGEGHIALQKNRHSISITIVLKLDMTDRDVVERFRDIVGVGTVRPSRRLDPKRAHHKMGWRWQAGKQRDTADVLAGIYPYLGARRRARAVEAMRVLKAQREARLRFVTVEDQVA